MADDPAYEKGLQKAYRLLAARARSEKELRSKLKTSVVDDGTLDRIVARLYELNYLDDKAFARQWARRLALDRLSGNRRIAAGLQEKGIDSTLCEQALAEIRQEVPERQAVRRIIRKKLKGEKLPGNDVRARRSLVQHLMGRGFAPGLIFEMITETQEDNSDDDGQSD